MCTAVCAAISAGGAQVANAAAPNRHCYPAKGGTWEQNDLVRVFYRGSATEAVLYACNLRTGRITKLGWFGEGGGSTWDSLEYVTVGGRFVAYVDAEYAFDYGFAGSRLVVVDSKTGKTRRGPVAAIGSAVPGPVVVRSNGTAAYLAEPSNGMFEVHRFAGGADTVLDAGPGIDRSSLALGGSRVYWIRDGIAHTAVI